MSASSGCPQHPAPCVLERARAGLDRAGEGDLGEAPRRGGLVAAQVDAIATVDGGTVAPAGAREVEGTASAVHHLAPTPGGALTPARKRGVQQPFQPQARIIRRLVGAYGHLG